MKTKKLLASLLNVIAEEAEKNSSFDLAIRNCFLDAKPAPKNLSMELTGKRSAHRRNKAELDPVLLARESESALKLELLKLDIEQLRDVIAEYGMDNSKLVMKWVDKDKVIARIVEISLSRSRKGDAFRKQPEDIIQGEFKD